MRFKWVGAMVYIFMRFKWVGAMVYIFMRFKWVEAMVYIFIIKNGCHFDDNRNILLL
jgi:hypothetical protein